MLGKVFSKPRITCLSSFVSVGDEAQPERVTVPEACGVEGAAVFPCVVLAPTAARANSPSKTAATSNRWRFMCGLLN
jgi:hypothetical protein